LPATPRTDPYLQDLLHTVLTLDVTLLGVWRRSEHPDKHAQHEEWAANGQRPVSASSRWAAVDFAGTVSCTRGEPPDAPIATGSADSPVPHGIGSNRAARSAAILRLAQSARCILRRSSCFTSS